MSGAPRVSLRGPYLGENLLEDLRRDLVLEGAEGDECREALSLVVERLLLRALKHDCYRY
jgi:hypothetical protein